MLVKHPKLNFEIFPEKKCQNSSPGPPHSKINFSQNFEFFFNFVPEKL